MTEQIQINWVAGVYNWDAQTTKEIRKLGGYPRHNFCDIDVIEYKRHDAVLAIFREHKVDVISQKVGRGWHLWGDIVPYETWKVIWGKIKPYADPKWSPLTLRISKKHPEEYFEIPVYYKSNSEPQSWARALMHYLSKAFRDENPTDLWKSMTRCGLDKHFQCTVYKIESVK